MRKNRREVEKKRKEVYKKVYSWNLKLPSRNSGLKKRWYNVVFDVKAVRHGIISTATGFVQMLETTN